MLVDLRFELVLVYENAEGRNKTKLIMRDRPDPMSIKGRSWRKQTENVSGVYTVAYSEDILALVAARTLAGTRPAHLRFRCFARDGMSGIGKQFEMKYEGPLERILYGSFEKGKSRRVIREEPHEGWTRKMALFAPDASPADSGLRAPAVATGGKADGTASETVPGRRADGDRAPGSLGRDPHGDQAPATLRRDPDGDTAPDTAALDAGPSDGDAEPAR
ncbi:hypothetical protein ACFWUQ_05745 [Streptomyces sp. NPDC058662]|uniref:hypothetical protein n=1 Tax=Streptomyces sp. NPDC058662 TaxID=3346583 RepID=UPI00364BA12B